LSAGASTSLANSAQSFTLEVVNLGSFPVVTPPLFKTPADGALSTLLTNNQVVVDQSLIDQYNKKVGDTFTVHASTSTGAGLTLHLKRSCIVHNADAFAQPKHLMLISSTDDQAADPKMPRLYYTVNVATADKAHTNQAPKPISNQFPIANITTAEQALKN